MCKSQVKKKQSPLIRFLNVLTVLVLLAAILSTIVRLTISNSVGRRYPVAVMIAVAAFTFGIVIKAVARRKGREIGGDTLDLKSRHILNEMRTMHADVCYHATSP